MRLIIALVCSSLIVLTTVNGLQAQNVTVPGKATPEQEVMARKFAMRALNADLRDIRLKITRGDSDGLISPALNISAIALYLPYAFARQHQAVYPVKGSQKFFKGGSPEDVQAGAEYLNVQAAKLLRQASGKDLKALDQQNNRIKRACVSCHNQLRGEN